MRTCNKKSLRSNYNRDCSGSGRTPSCSSAEASVGSSEAIRTLDSCAVVDVIVCVTRFQLLKSLFCCAIKNGTGYRGTGSCFHERQQHVHVEAGEIPTRPEEGTPLYRAKKRAKPKVCHAPPPLGNMHQASGMHSRNAPEHIPRLSQYLLIFFVRVIPRWNTSACGYSPHVRGCANIWIQRDDSCDALPTGWGLR